MPYSELHAHSNFSFLEGVRLRRKLVLRVRELAKERWFRQSYA